MRSSAGEHFVDIEGVTGSIPVASTIPSPSSGAQRPPLTSLTRIASPVTALADHVYVLAQGGLIAQGSPAEIAANPLVIEAYLGRGAAERLAHA